MTGDHVRVGVRGAAQAADGSSGLPPAHGSALFDSTYRSLAERVTPRGYAPTSLTDPGNQEHANWYAVGMLETYPGLRGDAQSINAALG
jgi:hypothetical protein